MSREKKKELERDIELHRQITMQYLYDTQHIPRICPECYYKKDVDKKKYGNN